MKYQLYREQQLNCDLATAWTFFSSPKNLSKITPKDMGFTVLSQNQDEPIFVGMTIDYTVSPLFNIPLKWRTKIIQVDFQKSFTDFQEKGPYKYWHHHHEFIPNEKGILMKDTVDYELPIGILGTIAHGLLIKKKLEKIFAFRYQVLHRDHHDHSNAGAFEKNDYFFVIFAIPTIALMYFGSLQNFNHLFFIGLGIMLYGMAYFLVHDIFIHQRFKVLSNTHNPYLLALCRAHKQHHKHLGKEDGECFGFLYVPFKYFRMYFNNDKK